MNGHLTLSQRFFGLEPAEVAVASDNPAAAVWAASHGYEFLHLSQALERDLDRCVLIATTKFWYSELSLIRESLRQTAVLWLPLGAFDGHESVVAYGLEQLDKIDWAAASSNQTQIEALVREHRDYVIADRRGRQLRIAMPAGTAISVGAPGVLRPGDFSSLVAHLEVETEYIAHGADPLVADGEIGIDSLLFALGPRTVMSPAERRAVQQLRASVSGPDEAVLVASGGHVVSFRIGLQDRVETLADLAGDILGTKISEFSFGLNSSTSDMRWGLNSPLNEGASGIHLGLGDGYTGVHLDFVASGAKTAPAPLSHSRINRSEDSQKEMTWLANLRFASTG